MTAILGLNINHPDAAAAIVVDGQLVAAVAEERLGRRLKHDPGFPAAAIRAVLGASGLRAADLDFVAINHDPAANRQAKARYVLAHPVSGLRAAQEHFRRVRRELGTLEQVAEACEVDPATLHAKLVPVEHHLAHIASAYYCSPHEGLTAGFSFDASGDFVSAMMARCEGTKIEVLDRVTLPHSLGFFYTAACQFIGFDDFGEEYKVMGLAPYGEDRFADFMRQVLELPSDGWFRLAEDFFAMHSGGESGELDERSRIRMMRLFTDRWTAALGPPRIRGAELTQRDMDIARSCQARFEEATLHCLRRLHKLVPTSRLASAGGCSLNGVTNARVLRDTPFTDVYLQSAATDDGLSVGAALWVWHNIVGGQERFHMQHAYWGPEHPERALRKAAESANAMPMRTLPLQKMPEVGAKLLRAGLVMGWYQGRSEWGPRALGNRSIVADPTQPQMKDLINTKIKRREMFRPFAPTIIRSAVSKYFEQDVFSPFMMHVVKIRPEWREMLPAVAHVDGTGRLQSIERQTNTLYFDLIENFGRLSGVPIVLNTSFNENEPIVDTPQQALDCFLRTGLDAICLGSHVIVKPEHEQALRQAVGEGETRAAATA